MKTINLQSLVELYELDENLSENSPFKKYIGSDVKTIDLESLKSLISFLKSVDSSNSKIVLNDFA